MIPSPLFGLIVRKTARINRQDSYAVIIPVHNKKEVIEKCIKTVSRQTVPANQIIIIDDKSTDGTRELLEQMDYKFKLLLLDDNIGKANATNKALEIVDATFTLILDADTYLEADYCKKVMRGFVPGTVGSIGKVLSATVKSFSQKSRNIEYLVSQRICKAMEVKYGGVWNLSGAATMWDTKWLKSIGGVPASSLAEDLELSWMAQVDQSVNYVDEAICYTEDPATLKDYVTQIYRWYSWRPALSWKRFKTLRKGLKFTIIYTILDSIIASIFLGVFAYFLIERQFDIAVTALSIDYIIFMALAGYEGWKAGRLKATLEGLPNNALLRYINIIVFTYAMINPRKDYRY